MTALLFRLLFQSTLPVRGATDALEYFSDRENDFNPRSPCGERPKSSYQMHITIQDFYPRSPCGERQLLSRSSLVSYIFLSTLPVRGATQSNISRAPSYRAFLSTLPVRGATGGSWSRKREPTNFYPRSPCGERRTNNYSSSNYAVFLSTLPVRGATAKTLLLIVIVIISIHAPRAGSDQFNKAIDGETAVISIHAPRAGSDFIRT